MQMADIMDSPALDFVLWLVTFAIVTRFGAGTLRRRLSLADGAREDFSMVLTISSTLLGLLIGFSFSMAVSRYDLRKSHEAQEANTIGTEYLRAALLPAADADKVRELLKKYLDQRIAFYVSRDVQELRQTNERVAQMQTGLWAAVVAPAGAQPSPTMALVVAGMNDVLDAQGYAQAAHWNRIPGTAWILLIACGIWTCLLMGYGTTQPKPGHILLTALPLLLSMSLALIADLDAPRGGLIRVAPENLTSLAQSLRGP